MDSAALATIVQVYATLLVALLFAGRLGREYGSAKSRQSRAVIRFIGVYFLVPGLVWMVGLLLFGIDVYDGQDASGVPLDEQARTNAEFLLGSVRLAAIASGIPALVAILNEARSWIVDMQDDAESH